MPVGVSKFYFTYKKYSRTLTDPEMAHYRVLAAHGHVARNMPGYRHFSTGTMSGLLL